MKTTSSSWPIIISKTLWVWEKYWQYISPQNQVWLCVGGLWLQDWFLLIGEREREDGMEASGLPHFSPFDNKERENIGIIFWFAMSEVWAFVFARIISLHEMFALLMQETFTCKKLTFQVTYMTVEIKIWCIMFPCRILARFVEFLPPFLFYLNFLRWAQYSADPSRALSSAT